MRKYSGSRLAFPLLAVGSPEQLDESERLKDQMEQTGPDLPFDNQPRSNRTGQSQSKLLSVFTQDSES